MSRCVTKMEEGKPQDMGVNVAIDDFGTGYSSLAHLKRLPVTKLKIVKSFIRDITTDADDRTIIKAVTQMAHTMKLKVAAEGVETEGQFEFLKGLESAMRPRVIFSATPYRLSNSKR